MPIFVSTTVFEDGVSAVDAARRLVNAGFSRIELGSTHAPEENLIDGLMDLPAEFITHNFFPPTADRLVLNLASGDKEIRAKSVGFMKKALDFAEDLGAALYTIHPGFLVDPAGAAKAKGASGYDFEFGEKRRFSDEVYGTHMDFFLGALEELDAYTASRGVRIALETQGSVTSGEFVLFDRPRDYRRFMEHGFSDRIGINLNLAHNHLAAKFHGFDERETITILKPRILAVEVSHNDGHVDDHQSLVAGAWYFDLLKDPVFEKAAVIFEGRNVGMAKTEESCRLLSL